MLRLGRLRVKRTAFLGHGPATAGELAAELGDLRLAPADSGEHQAAVVELERLQRRLAGRPGCSRSAEQGLEVVVAGLAGRGAQQVGFALHLRRGVEHGAHLRVGIAQQRHHGPALGRDLPLLVPRPQVQADHLQRQQRGQPPAHRPPAGTAKTPQRIAQGDGAAVLRCDVELQQVPQRAHRAQQALLVGENGDRAAEPALGRRGHGRVRCPARRLRGPLSEHLLGQGAADAHADHALGVGPGELHRRTGIVAEGRAEVAERHVFGPRHRHRALNDQASLVERRQLALEPGFVDHADPAGLAAGKAGCEREVHAVGVVEQLLLQGAGDRGAQPGGRCLGHGDAVPADVGVGEHDDRAVGLGQQRGLGAAVASDVQSVGRQHIQQLGRALARRRRGVGTAEQAGPRREQDDERGHVLFQAGARAMPRSTRAPATSNRAGSVVAGRAAPATRNREELGCLGISCPGPRSRLRAGSRARAT